jgi:iron complex transport system substrate-binding protein
MGSPAADGVFPRTVTHFGGTTEVPAAPHRVVVISTGQLDALLALGVVPVGATRGENAGLIPAYLAKAFPDRAAELGAMADLGLRTSPNIEAIASTKPDLILANKAGVEELAPALARIAPVVLTEGTGVNWKQDLLLLANGLGRAQEAQRLLDAFHAGAAALGARLGAPPTVSFLRITATRVRVFGVPSFVGSIAEDAGLPRPQAQSFGATSRDISSEQLGEADGGHIFYGVQGGTSELIGSDVWSRIPGVAGGHATSVDDDVWYLNAGPVAARLVLDGLASALT